MRSVSRLSLCLVALLLTAGAKAETLTWYLQDVMFGDCGQVNFFSVSTVALPRGMLAGQCGTARGSFNYDSDTNTYSNVSITTTTGSARTGAFYSFACGDDNPTCTGVIPSDTEVLVVTQASGDLTGTPGFDVAFTMPLSDSGGTINLETPALLGVAHFYDGQEASCVDATCSSPISPERFVQTGSVGSSETMQQYFSFGG